MNPNLFIRFKGIDAEHDSEVDLAELGESLVGFDSLFKEFASILRIEGQLEIKATASREGSIIVDVIAWLHGASAALPLLHKLIKRRGFKKALKPIVEDKAQSIEVSNDRKFKSSAKIDQENFQDYLAEDEQILPHLENGKTCNLDGKITSLKGTRGDSLTFHMRHGKDDFNLDVLPAVGATSKTYRQFYKETVQIEATVIRESLYKKPKLKLNTIHLKQSEFPLEATDDQNPLKR